MASAPLDAGTAGRTRTWVVAGLALLVLAAGALAITAVRNRETPTVTASALRLALAPPGDLTLGAGPEYPFGLSLAPDGRRLVFPAAKAGLIQLWLRDLTTGDSQALPGTDHGVLPFWAPDGRAIGFFASGRLRAITLENAGIADLAPALAPRGGAWHPNGDIIFAPENDGGLYRRRGSSGTVEPFTAIDSSAGDTSHRHPALLDGGRSLVFHVRSREAIREGIWLASFDDPTNRRRLIGSDAHGVVVDETLLYSSDGALVAQRVDLASRTLSDRAVLLGAPVGHGPQNQLFSTGAGDMVILGAPALGLRELRWTDRRGVPAGVVGEPMDAWEVRLAPSGASVAVTRLDPQLNTLDIWTYDGDRPLPRRISPALDADETPVWARDGARLAWVSARRTVTLRGALAELPEEPVRTFEHAVRVTDWSPNDQWIVVSQSRPETHDDLWLLSPDGRQEPRAYAQSPFNEVQGIVSPDGRWIAYASDESGRFEIYVDAFPVPGTRARLTGGGGIEPRWKSDGSELYFRRGSEIHAVTPRLSGGPPEAMSSTRLFDAGTEIRAYDVTPDGQRFLLNVPAADNEPLPITVLVHWQSLLRAGQAAGGGRQP